MYFLANLESFAVVLYLYFPVLVCCTKQKSGSPVPDRKSQFVRAPKNEGSKKKKF
jgi:hypothetical protein